MNVDSTQYLPYSSFDVFIWSNDHFPPHFHLRSKQEGFELRYDFNGTLLSVERRGKRRRTDSFSDITKLVKLWLFSKPQFKESFVSFPTYQDYCKFVWRQNNS